MIFKKSHYNNKLRFNMRRSFVCLCKYRIDESFCDDTIKVQSDIFSRPARFICGSL